MIVLVVVVDTDALAIPVVGFRGGNCSRHASSQRIGRYERLGAHYVLEKPSLDAYVVAISKARA